MPILAKNEAHFDLGGYVNKRNCRICDTENPHAYIEKPTHPKRFTVWWEFWRRGIIGPFFFENEQGEAVTVNSEAIVIGPCWKNLVHKNWRGAYWQHLVSTGRRYVPHSRSYTRCFAPCFWRSPYQPQSWCRLATSELRSDTVGLFYLWGAVKDKCYAAKPETINALKDNIREAIGEIQLHTIDNVFKNCTDHVATVWPAEAAIWMILFFHY